METKKKKEKIPPIVEIFVDKMTILQALNHFKITGLFRQFFEKKYLGKEMSEQEWRLEFKNSGLIF